MASSWVFQNWSVVGAFGLGWSSKSLSQPVEVRNRVPASSRVAILLIFISMREYGWSGRGRSAPAPGPDLEVDLQAAREAAHVGVGTHVHAAAIETSAGYLRVEARVIRDGEH